MKKISLIAILGIVMSFTSSKKSIYDQNYSFTSLEGKEISLNQFKGKKLLIVNTASKCGYTRQYKQLQELHQMYGEKLTIIGMPCNQFSGQEPGSEAEIKSFCQKNFGVEFLMSSKIDVAGSNQAPIYKWLTSEQLNGLEDSSVGWNFQKYLINENGELLGHYSSSVSPTDKKITDRI